MSFLVQANFSRFKLAKTDGFHPTVHTRSQSSALQVSLVSMVKTKGTKLHSNLEKAIEGKETMPKESLGVYAAIVDFHQSRCGLRIHLAISHIFAVAGLPILFQGQVMISSIIFAWIIGEWAQLGVTAGVHRLWSHRSYKARTPMKIFLAIGYAFAGQESLWLWAAWHRLHHKFTDTDADPHDTNRGFFYSHIGWLLTYDHQKFLNEVKLVDVSDLERDPIVMFHHRYYPFFVHGCVYIIPTVAHFYGYKPYDTSITPVESKLVSILAAGEGWHNYHHAFPRDYKAAEL
ncbi:unnamed protein product, partial [Allacma fusca]